MPIKEYNRVLAPPDPKAHMRHRRTMRRRQRRQNRKER